MDRAAWRASVHRVTNSRTWLNWFCKCKKLNKIPSTVSGSPSMMLICMIFVQFSSVAHHVRLFATSWITAHQASLSITNSRSSLRLTSIESVISSSHLTSVITFSSCPQSLPASESFPMNQLFAWGGQSNGVSALASFLPKKSHGWSPLEWTGGSPCSPRDSQESSPTQFKSINSSALSLLHSPTLTSIHDHWKNHSLD